MRKNEQKCLKKPENQQNWAQKTLNSGLHLKILMPDLFAEPCCAETKAIQS